MLYKITHGDAPSYLCDMLPWTVGGFGRLNVYICGSWNSGVREGPEAWEKRDKWAEKNGGAACERILTPPYV